MTKTSAPKQVSVAKSLDEPLKQVLFIAMQEGTDLHGDYTDAEEIRKAKESFNRALLKQNMANLFHMVTTDKFSILESYLAPCDMQMDEHFVQKGTWLMNLQIHDDSLWEMIKAGEINGISIGALAQVEPLEE